MSTVGGPTWDSAGILNAGTTPSTNRTDLVVGDGTAADPFGDTSFWPCWWTLTYASDTWVTLDGTPSTAEDTTIGADPDLWVFTGTDYAFRVDYVSDYDSAGEFKPLKSFIASAGVVYHVLMGAPDSAGAGIATYGLTVTAQTVAPPSNDNIADATPLVMDAITPVLVTQATLEADETAVCGAFTFRSAWYSFTAPFTGKFGADLFDCDSSDFNQPEWTLWTGTGFSNLTLVGAGYAPDAVLDIVEGTSYLLRMAAQDEVTNFIEFRFRQWLWSDWVQDPDVVQGSSFAFQTLSAAALPATELTHDFGTSPTSADLDAWANSAMGDQYNEMVTSIFTGYDDAWITDGLHGFFDATQHTAAHEWSQTLSFTTGGSILGQVDMSQSLTRAIGVRGSVPTYTPTAHLEYETPDAKLVGAHLVVSYTASMTEPSIVFGGEYSVKAYWPTTSDLQVMSDPTSTRTLVGPTSFSPGAVTDTTTLDLTEADLASAPSPFSGVTLWCPINTAGAASIAGSFTGMNTSAVIRADVTVDQATSTWTFRPPRYRTLSAVIVDPVPDILHISGQIDFTRVRPYNGLR